MIAATDEGMPLSVVECVNLRERFGDRYRVGYEESYYADRGDSARKDDPWLQIVLCQHGHIYPRGGQGLAASTDKRGTVAKRLAALDCTTMLQDVDDGINAAFHVDDFDRVAQLMKPRRRRRGRPMSEEEKKRLAEMGRSALEKHRRATCQTDSEGQICVSEVLGGSGVG
jgi:hypothetical protein